MRLPKNDGEAEEEAAAAAAAGGPARDDGKLVVAEGRVEGTLEWSTVAAYARAVGRGRTALSVVLLALGQVGRHSWVRAGRRAAALLRFARPLAMPHTLNRT